MNFKPGDKVWIDVPVPGYELPVGTYAGIVVSICHNWRGSWIVDVEGHRPPPDAYFAAHERHMRRRYDPPDWVRLCKLDQVRPSVPKEFV
jgi:hypothetical protein